MWNSLMVWKSLGDIQKYSYPEENEKLCMNLHVSEDMIV